ncbi:EscR/YscR/HrcR family type III secretion system export apparatus protein [Chromobacterium subtsugae]|uniref:EscR/YscR/HrcR family type III secretion system export apparatus protein n=1 Tax=Chromobacterium subtsugae TaxID=251747 RepID=A0ABS7FER2_9NEIS|nr:MULTISPECIES: EscR/YscR/HrcR family type III secretion system export apparatus protein [Chromobacterium]KUM05627.1 type III secretion system protein [Chromobacterium subtsugae]KZE88095.1 type III secretion system protein [Chromobacterium sp. F49]MBW7565736.1 EscR/YscR/HrcR family type III secretion system export apparatus protein [Chromobacterium subtsugae]MBW8288559.1 EscR/YscR/HrcR family type III secretion system export apparatus protein [Chromobacterium subtsugae]OBU86807.1 type III sec
MSNDISLIALLAFSTLLPFLIASGTCFIKFSIVFVMVRNALGLQQVPSNMTLNGIALMLSMFVMLPVAQQAYGYYQEERVSFTSVESVSNFVENGLDGYRAYLQKYSDPELTRFFEKAQVDRAERETGSAAADEQPSIFALLPAYALSEIKSAFKIGFYLYLPFVVVDLVISSILLALGMMMMSPVTISVPIKLVLFVALDGWTLLSKGLVLQYLDLAT